MGAEIHQCFASYAAMSQTEGLGEISQGLLLVLEKLKQFAGGSVKRCKDKNLEEAHQLLSAVSKGLWVLDRSHVLPLVKCVLALQMETTNNSSSFLRLEKLVATLSEGDEALVSEQLNQLMSSLVEHKEALSPGSLQTVCMFIEESMLGRSYWQNNLMQLLKCIAATFDSMSQEQISRNEQWCYITVKTCLQLFKLMPKEVAPLVWDGTGDSKALQSILGSLVHIVMGKAACRDIRMLAGTAVSMLVNTAPEPCRGAAAVLELYHLLNAGEGQFGMLSLPSRAWDSDGLERLVLTRGLLASCKREILSCLLDGTQQQVACSQWEGSQLDNTQRRDGQAKGWTRKNAGLAKACLLLDVLLPAVLILMEKQKDCLYYCFQVFTLWLQRFQESLDEIWKVKESRILDGNSRLLQELTQFLWNNAESPVEGVSDFIHSSFQHLLEIYSLECDHFKDTERPLYEQFLQRVLCLPWQAKARYVPLCAILPYLGPGKVLDTYKDLPQHLLSCLSTNHLCPAASDLYKTILQQQRKVWTEEQEDVSEEELARKWGQHWLPTLTCGLTSSNSFLQSNTSNYLLVWTLRLFPASYALLAEGFKGKDSTQIHAWVTLLNIQKTVTGVLPAGQETLERLSACLCAKEDNIRLAALSLLCSSPRTNQSLSVMDIQLLKELLPLNLNCDSSSFRQFLQASVKKALVRLRDSSLAALRQRMKNKECSTGEDLQSPVVRAVDFVEWLLQLCASSLMSGSNFQRRKSALLLLAAVLETCTDSWSPERKKGQPPRNMAALLSRAKSKGCWDFFSRSNTLMLLSCLQDSTNEIRELAAELLVSYFPPAFPESIAVALFERALEAVSSPRVPEAEAGAVMMKTVFQKSDTCTLKRILAKQEQAVECQHLSFIEYLLGVLQVHISSAHRDLLQAAHSTPIHGVVLALRRCLLEVPAVVASMSEARLVQCWRDFLSRLVESVRDAVRLLLGMLQGKQASSCSQEAVAPSFADVGNAIGSLIQLGKDPGQEDEEDPILLSEEHSLVLTCCWVSVKEIGLLLGGLAEKILLLPPQVGCGPLLPLPVVKMASEGFQEILLRCRHWGAVEGCSVGFTKFCATLLSLPDLELQEVPKAILEQGLVLLSSPRSSSITRRAAGFPMLFLCILAGEGPTKSRPLLTHGCQTLLALASMPLSQDWNQTLDLPQVSAVHVLQTLVRGSELGAALRQYVTPMVILVLKALDSPSWAMRNAAIQLFGALTVRLLGQKRSRGDSHIHGGVSPEALFSLYPQLKHILLEELSSAVAASGELRDGKFPLCPALYAILTFLAKLQPSADGVNSSSRCFLEPLIGLAGNPIYAARVMAARALVPLVPAAEYGTLLLRLTSDLPQPGDAFSHNALHGQLLQIESVLAHALRVNHLSPDTLLSVTCQLEDRLWLVTSVQQCPLVRLAYLQVVSLLVGTSPCDFAQRVWVAVRGELDHSKPVEKAGLSHVQVGSVTFCQLAVRFLCNEGTRLASPETVHGVCSLLQKGSTDLQAAILTWVIEMEDRKNPDLMKELLLTLWEKLEEVLKGRTDCTFLKLYLEAFVHLNSNQCQFVSHKPFGPAYAASRGILLSMVESGDFSPEIQCLALCVLASLLTAGFEDLTLLERWCFIIERCSEPFSPEVLRMAAAKSLNIAGADMVWRAREDSSQSLCTMAVRLINVAISLLQDEDHEVRLEATIFASLVVQRQPPLGVSSPGGCALLHSNKGLVSLFHLLVEEFWVCPETFACLVHHLPSTDLSDTLADLEDKGAVSLYKEDEPNVYAEPAVLSQMLLPFLFWLLDRASASPRLWESIQAWLKATGPGLLTTLQHCMSWWSQDGSTSLHLKALGSQKMHVAVTALLVKAALVVHILEILEEKEQPSIEEIHYSSQDLKDTVLAAQKALAQHGMVVTVNVEIEQMGRQGYLGCVSVTS
ncbi:thyroid adenoma-associated protein homolog isoform X1 [Sphaerodactylus townsendi]|uniref:thyroid adenoma-associated protein homolog isoform X1 n=1 Tax=Sphaerodactylus townsendi TaxID=933632 RepID=UPI002026B15E|nr:thyroid adenoma-associated protein homolog isoform X1 [Sphaerodactylus townsendi]